MRATIQDRLWARTSIDPDSCCWVADKAAQTGGYAQIWYEGRMELVHRVSYQLFKGPIPKGKKVTIDHVKARGCTSHACWNPAHLELVTSRENTMRGDTLPAANSAKDRCPKGHLYDEANTRVWNGHRSCRACGRDHWRARNRPDLLGQPPLHQHDRR